MSIPSGYESWKSLLKDVAEEVGLDVNKESDLVSLAQFHVNQRGGRARINEVLIDEFTRDAVLTKNHELIASLPITSIWTTNYDDLLERAYAKARKKTDVKTTVENLAQTVKGRDVIIYKMHGDSRQPHDAILTREDYETYDSKREAFSIALKGDLVEKTFLFLGFSFTDPNIDHLLSRIRGLLGKNQRTHYCIMKWPDLTDPTSPTARAEYEYDRKKLELRIADLGRYGIQAVMIDSYAEIPQILQNLNDRVHYRDIMVSGTAADFGPLGQDRVEKLMHRLGTEIVKRGFRLTTGFGLGIGGAIAYGALREVYSGSQAKDAVQLLPFPQQVPPDQDRGTFYRAHREMMISRCGFLIFVCGNKEIDGKIALAPGVMIEFALAANQGKIPIPIAATGWAAQQILTEIRQDVPRYYGTKNVIAFLETLADPARSDGEYIEAIFGTIKEFER
jgi:hypothetical protein